MCPQPLQLGGSQQEGRRVPCCSVHSRPVPGVYLAPLEHRLRSRFGPMYTSRPSSSRNATPWPLADDRDRGNAAWRRAGRTHRKGDYAAHCRPRLGGIELLRKLLIDVDAGVAPGRHRAAHSFARPVEDNAPDCARPRVYDDYMTLRHAGPTPPGWPTSSVSSLASIAGCPP